MGTVSGQPVRLSVYVFLAILVFTLPFASVFDARQAQGQEAAPQPVGPFVYGPVEAGSSPEVRTLGIELKGPGDETVREVPRRPVTGVEEIQPRIVDPLLGETISGSSPRTPAPSVQFEGMTKAEGGGYIPPDTVGDVGPDHYVQMVNTAFSIYDKSGTRLSGPTPINQLWTGQGNDCETENNGDPIVLYDQFAGRWLLSQFAVSGGPPYYQCVAISKTGDPTGAYWLYRFQAVNFNDYPKLAVWPDAYYMGANESPGAAAYAFERAQMLTGGAAQSVRFADTGIMWLPSDADGATPPPAGSPNYFYRMSTTDDSLYLYAFHVDWITVASSTFGLSQTVALSPFNYGVCGFSWNCIPQLGTSQKLDVISEWPMWRLQYRNFGTHQTLVGNFTVDINDFANHAGIRWFELRKTTGDWGLHQEGTVAPDSHHRWMGSIAMDGFGNIALGYSVSSSTMYPAIRYTGRLASDAAGTMQAEASLIDGTSYQTTYNRWGDYSSMNVDPAGDQTFWYTNEYYTSPGSSWRTRVGAFDFQSTLVSLTNFAATASGSDIFVEWKTASEIDHAGFNLLKGMEPAGAYTEINSILIPAEGSASAGAYYTYLDENVAPGIPHYYKLEAIDDGGASTLYGPVSATVESGIAWGPGSPVNTIVPGRFGVRSHPMNALLWILLPAGAILFLKKVHPARGRGFSLYGGGSVIYDSNVAAHVEEGSVL